MASKKITITEGQKKELDMLLESERQGETVLPTHLFRDIKYNNTSISDFPFFSSPNGKRYLQKMTLDRYNEVLGNFSDDVIDVDSKKIEEELTKAIEKCRSKEEKIRPQLEALCVEVLSELFNLPENSFSLRCSLVSEIEPEKDFAVNPMPINPDHSYNTMEEMDGEDIEVQKRRMINCISMGTAMRLFNKARSLYLEKLFDLDEELPYLYSRFEKLNELYLFKTDIKIRDRAHQQGGYVEVMLGNEDRLPMIKSKAILFPILLTESIKGFMELFASHGLPDNLEEAKTVIGIADALTYEPWDMRIGPVLFDEIFSRLDDAESTDIPYFYSEFVQLNGSELLDVVKACVCHSSDIDDYLNDIFDEAKHDAEYDEFECDIMQKQTDDTLIVDQEEF